MFDSATGKVSAPGLVVVANGKIQAVGGAVPSGADVIDLGDYVVEHLALEIDPFPRRPGAVFEAPEPLPETSPFAALKALKPRGDKS